MRSKQTTFQTKIEFDDYIVRDHRVHEVRILPGVTLLDSVYRMAAAEGLQAPDFSLRNILFHRPIAVAREFDRRVRFELSAGDDARRIQISSARMPHNNAADHVGDFEVNADCELHAQPVDAAVDVVAGLNFEQLKQTALRTVDMADVYAALRKLEITHYEFMQVLGRAWVGNDYVLAELTLGELAGQYVPSFFIHPAFLDASTIVPHAGALTAGIENQKPYIPIYIKKFAASSAGGESVFVFARSAASQTDADVLTADVSIYDAQTSEPIAYCAGLAAKRIRHQDLIDRLVDQPSVAAVTSSSSSSSSVVAGALPAGGGDLKQELIALVASLSKVAPDRIDPAAGFYDLGLESVHLLKIVKILESRVGAELYPTLLFEYQTINALSDYLTGEYGRALATATPAQTTQSAPIAASVPVFVNEKYTAIDSEPARVPERVLMLGHDWAVDPNADGPGDSSTHVLVFDDPVGTIEPPGFRATHVRSGKSFQKNFDGRGNLKFNPARPEELEYIFEEIALDDSPPGVVIFGPRFGRALNRFRKSADPEQLLRRRLALLRTITRAVSRYKLPVERLIFFLRESEEPDFAALAAITGFARTAVREGIRPRIRVVVLDAASGTTDAEFSDIVAAEVRNESPELKVRYRGGRRLLRRFTVLEEFGANVPAKPVALAPIRRNNRRRRRGQGAVLITGGLGGLGLIFARYFAREVRADLMLVGRSPLPSPAVLNELRGYGARVEYFAADVSKPRSVKRMIAFAKRNFGGLRGVLHCAGAVGDALILTPDTEDLSGILGPKVTGTVHLDRLTAKEPLEFFVLFSSISAVFGNPGQSTYASGNRFMDLFAAWREDRHRAGLRSGRSLSINWPLWAAGGMQIAQEQVDALYRETGMTTLSTEAGLRAFERALASGRRQVTVISGDVRRLRSSLLADGEPEVRKVEQEIRAQAQAAVTVSKRTLEHHPIAVIGMSGRYPGAENLEQFWRNLREGRDSVSEIPRERWDVTQQGAPDDHPLSRWGGFIADVDKFDALYFNIPPTMAPYIDPQERLFLEIAAAAVQDAGYRRRDLERARVGVFAGVMWNDYRLLGYSRSDQNAPASTASTFSSVANRVSYFLNLNGPSMAVDTACSSSLTALHLACRSIQSGESDLAIAGGVNLLLHPDKYVLLSQLHMTSSDGRCRSFGAGGDGYVPGEGVGAVLLKPLERALADGDAIYGIIRGSAVNHGGRTGGYTVPHSSAQADVISQALRDAQIAPESIDYIEAHGTGTSLGDPIEIQGLAKAFSRQNAASASCALGSVKSNIGHLESAAGVAALTKTLLQLKHAELVPSLHSDEPNPAIDFSTAPFHLQHERAPWIRRGADRPRRAGVSSFGAGGANAHVIVEEFYDSRPPTPHDGPELFVISARAEDRLRELAGDLLTYLKNQRDQNSAPNVADLAFTLREGREEFEYRLAFVARDLNELIDALARFVEFGPDLGAASAKTQMPMFGRAERDQPPARMNSSDKRPDTEELRALGEQWVRGASLDDCLPRLRAGHTAKRIGGLPGYPYERRSYWFGGAYGSNQSMPVKLNVNSPSTPAYATLTDHRTHETLLADFARVFATRFAVETELAAGRSAIEDYSAALLQDALADMGLGRDWSREDPEQLRRRLGVVDAYGRLFAALLDILRRAMSRSILFATFDAGDANRLAAIRAMREKILSAHPQYAPLLRLIETCVAAYPKILRGAESATDVMFPDASMELVAPIYRDNRLYAFFNAMAAESVRLRVSELLAANRAPVRILEIGAGTGGTSRAVFEALATIDAPDRLVGRISYHYTDISAGFTSHGRQVYGAEFPFIVFQPLDIEKDIHTQGFEAHSFDVVIAANAIHATRDIRAVLRRVHGLLNADGMVVLNEAIRGADWLTLTFGLLDGWWLYSDEHLRIAHSPLLSAAAWRETLVNSGFESANVFSGSSKQSARSIGAMTDAADEEIGQGLIVAFHDGRTIARRPDANTYAAVVAETTGQRNTQRTEQPEMQEFIRACFARELGVAPAQIDVGARFSDYGVDSILAVRIVKSINQTLGTEMKPTVLFDYSSVRDLAGYMATIATRPAPGSITDVAGAPRTPTGDAGIPSTSARSEHDRILVDEPIAIIGMAGRFPDADDYETFWENIKNGRFSVGEVPKNRWDIDRYYDPRPQTPDRTYSRQGGYLRGVENFDPMFFGITPAEAEFIDPQQRVFLEEAWKAFEDAGYNPQDFARKRCGVFVGAPPSDYDVLMQDAGLSVNPYVFTGNSQAILSARISYFLNLTGPSIAIDTACSSTLVALYQACLGVASGECEVALAGAVSIFTSPQYHILASSLGMLSPEGKCKTFDASADGFVIGEGVGVFLIKRLRDAERDGDHIHAVIRGIGLNQDGKTNGITAPSSRSQRELQLDVFRKFGVHPESIGYVEAHGTGTPLGDPIEVEALSGAYGEYTRAKQFVPIGSVKTNIGHSSLAAGAAQLMKVMLAFKYKAIPPSLHFAQENPLIEFSGTPFYVNTSLKNWEHSGALPRRATVSSFGFSGTNGFVVLEEYTPPTRTPARENIAVLLPLSAQSSEQLRESARALREYLLQTSAGPAAPRLSDIAATLQVGRAAFEERVAFVVRSREELLDQLADFVATEERSANNRRFFRGSIDLDDGVKIAVSANEIRAALSAPDLERDSRLRDLAGRWVSGNDVPFQANYSNTAGGGETFRRVPLPTYPFARLRCWLPGTPESPVVSRSAAVIVSDIPTIVRDVAADILSVTPQQLEAHTPLGEFGLDAVQGALLATRLADRFQIAPETLRECETRTLGEIVELLDSSASRPVAPTIDAIPAAASAVIVLEVRASGDQTVLQTAAEQYLIEAMAREFKIPGSRIRPKAPLQNYGIDSVLITKFNVSLGRVFGELPKTLFFQYQTVRELAAYFVSEHGARLREVTGVAVQHTAHSNAEAAVPVQHETIITTAEHEMRIQEHRDVAIIGMAGKFPGADSVEEFWRNLKAGMNCITEIPPERWDHSVYWNADKDAEEGSSYSKWGGFIRDVDAFDPSFFNITPRDAELMDPQQRLFMMASWAAIEDAGYTRERLRESARLRGKKDVGVYTGINYAEYQYFMNVPIAAYWSVANRVSYHFDFNGPSMAIDTACSASLTALHVAYESVRRGECAYALAGGVNVSIHPGKYVLMSAGRFASSEGRCRSFGARGDGYVASEGIVSLLLKPLSEARADGDRVYGVIKGSAVNHGGKTNGFTVPNPTAQAELAYEVLRESGVNPRTISYVEAHGTGTPLGDPIEITGLTQAWSRFTQDRQFCPIGSAKSSVGHLEGAAGAAGVVKLLLQFQHKQLPPSIHSETLNPNIDFAQTPFVVQRTLADWPRPVLEENGQRVEIPRRGTVSSFGAGGSNAHMILEEGETQTRASQAQGSTAELIILSARKPERLRQYARDLRDFLVSAGGATEINFVDLAYTLQIGREPFECRLAVLAKSQAELIEALDVYLAGQSSANIYTGEISANRMYDDMPGREATDRDYLRTLFRGGHLNRIAGFWTDGWDIDWQDLPEDRRPTIISAPTYPFAKERYWLGANEPFIAVTPDGRPRSASTASPAKPEIKIETKVEAKIEDVTKHSNGHATNGKTPHAGDIARPTSPHSTQPSREDAIPPAREDAAQANGNGKNIKYSADTVPEFVPIVGEATNPEVERQLRDEIKTIFGALAKISPDQLDENQNFMQIGFDSVASVRMMNRLMKKFGVRIPATAMHEYPTIQAFAAYLVASGIMTAETLAAGQGDGVAPGIEQGHGTGSGQRSGMTPKIDALELPQPLKTDRIFLTGATGVLGGKILRDLLDSTESKVYCLVRADDARHAHERIWSVLAVYDPERKLQERYDRRVVPVLGDVTQDLFGQTPEDYERLVADVDFTIHAAGKTILVTFYDVLAPINVEGTQRVIDFCLRTEQKYLAYISSFSVMGDRLNFNNPPFTEQDLEMGQDYDHLPYQETKYNAEKLVRAATEQGLVWNIFRPGNIMGDSENGQYPLSEVNVKGAYYDIFKTFIEIGTSMMTPIYFDITPVDYVSRGLLYLSIERPVYRQTFHLTNPDIRRSFEVFKYLENFGYRMNMLTLDEFIMGALSGGVTRIGSGEPYESQSLEMVKYGIEIFGKIHYEESSYADCTWTRSILEPAGVHCPPIRELVFTYLKYCIEHGYIPSPEAQVPGAIPGR